MNTRGNSLKQFDNQKTTNYTDVELNVW